MKVCLLQILPEAFQGNFASYFYQEDLSAHPSFVDIRAIVQENTESWLDDLAVSHGDLSTAFLKYGPWWWLSSYSRLDARPWGQESTIKPLFFARAILEWAKKNSQAELFLIGAPLEVALYLQDFDPTAKVEGANIFRKLFFGTITHITQKTIFKLKLLKEWVGLWRICFRGDKKQLGSKRLVVYERFAPGQTSDQARDYFFDKLFEASAIGYACIDPLSFGSPARKKDDQTFFVLDQVTWQDAFFVFWRNICFDGLMIVVGINPPACVIAGKTSDKFWRYYLWGNYSKGVILKELCVYRIFKRLAAEKSFESIVYPYEEKGYERALLLAVQGHGIKTIGYAPHPQHHLAVSMKDSLKPAPLRPSLYGVCGKEYIDYFEQWAAKPVGAVRIWGSAKSWTRGFGQKVLPKDLKIFLLLSHPYELEVFGSWLKAESKLCEGVTYLVRVYKSVLGRVFTKRFEAIMSEFPFVREAKGDFTSGLAQCDLAMFNGTSAGLLAVNSGKIAVHAALDDFFEINPCFNHLDSMLNCTTAAALAQRFQELRAMSHEQLNAVWQNQKNFVAGVFAPIDRPTIEKDLLCRTV